MAINKVIYDGNTLIDITDTTATASDVASGKYFYTNAGVKTAGSAILTPWKIATSLSGTPYYDEQDYSTSIYFDNSDGLISNVNEIGAYIISTVTDLNSDTDWWSAVSIVHDSTGTICYWYNEYQFEKRTDVSVSLSIDGDNIVFTSTNANFRLNDNNAYKIILLYGGDGNLAFHTADYTPSSNSKTATFTIDEPYLYLCANNSNQVQDFSTMYNVTKLGDEIWGFDYDIYSDSDVSDSYSSGTLTITIDSNARPYFKKNNVHRIYYLTESEIETPLNLETVTKTYTPSTSAVTDSITPSAGYDGIGEVDVTVSAVPLADVALEVGSEYYTDNGNRKWRFKAYADTDGNNGWYEGGTSDWYVRNAIATGTSVTPTESAQTIGGANTVLEGAVTVNAIPSNYVGSGITQRTSSDLTASGATVTAPAGYYANDATNTIASGSQGSPSWSVQKNSSAWSVQLTFPNATEGYYSHISGAGYGISLEDKSVTPSTSQQVVTPTSDYKYLNSVTVDAMPSGTEGTPTATKSAVNNHALTVTPSVTNTAGYIAGGTHSGTAVSVSASELVSGTLSVTSSGTKDVTNYASASIPSGTAGTPTATKSAVNNHALTVTPSVTNTTGFITGSTINGTAVSVSASELVSGSQTVTTNDTYDVTNLAELVVNVSGGGSSTMTIGTKTTTLSASASSISFTGLSGNPLAFVVSSMADLSTGGTKAVAVAYDGTSFHGMDVTTQAEADTGFTKSYSSGTLTITATTATFEANEYKLVYAYGGSSSDIHTADVQVGSGATSITFSGLSGRPLYFSCIFKSSFSTSSGYQRVIDVVNDGTSTYGNAFDSSAKALTSWSYTYSGGSLTISSTGTNNGGYFHQPGYYCLVYAVDPNALTFQNKTGVGASTSSQTIYADSGYDALESVQINAVSQTNLVAGNIKSGTTVTISNGNTNLWSVTGTYTGGGGGGGGTVGTGSATLTTAGNTISFTNLSGTPIAWFVRCTTQLSSSGSTTYYYVDSARYNGTNTQATLFRIGSTRRIQNQTSGISYSYSGNTLTITTTATAAGNTPGFFYNGTYELTYVY